MLVGVFMCLYKQCTSENYPRWWWKKKGWLKLQKLGAETVLREILSLTLNKTKGLGDTPTGRWGAFRTPPEWRALQLKGESPLQLPPKTVYLHRLLPSENSGSTNLPHMLQAQKILEPVLLPVGQEEVSQPALVRHEPGEANALITHHAHSSEGPCTPSQPLRSVSSLGWLPRGQLRLLDPTPLVPELLPYDFSYGNLKIT